MDGDVHSLPGQLPQGPELQKLALELGVVHRDTSPLEVERAVLADELDSPP